MPSPTTKPNVILFNKPFQVLCQFSEHEGKATLAKYINTPNIYPAGRLDHDSEGLLILTDDGQLQSLITHPNNKLPKTYWAQLEGDIDNDAIAKLSEGVILKDGITLPATIQKISSPEISERTPAIRKRANKPTSWVELTISEGRNRQVRRMTAAVGYPTLRLIRISIGPWSIGNLQPGEWKEATLPSELSKKLDRLTTQKSQKRNSPKASKKHFSKNVKTMQKKHVKRK
ncbi:pseudouridine synthase [Gammaproteobacteria bacterium 42_54_T18]|nr:pseudouridine synthase [Gammaproteobacteria bacterium 42_54_T18]